MNDEKGEKRVAKAVVSTRNYYFVLSKKMEESDRKGGGKGVRTTEYTSPLTR